MFEKWIWSNVTLESVKDELNRNEVLMINKIGLW